MKRFAVYYAPRQGEFASRTAAWLNIASRSESITGAEPARRLDRFEGHRAAHAALR